MHTVDTELLDWGLIFQYDNAHKLAAEDKKQIGTVIEAQVQTDPVLAGVCKVKVIGYVREGQKAVHPDQRFSASCSSKPNGVCDMSVMILVCHNSNQGWYVIPLMMKEKRTR